MDNLQVSFLKKAKSSKFDLVGFKISCIIAKINLLMCFREASASLVVVMVLSDCLI